MPLQVVIALVHAQAYPEEWRLDESQFPDPALLRGQGTDRTYNDQLRLWQNQETGHAIRLRLSFDQAVRDLLGETPSGEALVLSKNRRALFDAIREATSYGADPARIQPHSGLESRLVELWPELERRLPILAQPRQDLWLGAPEVRVRTQRGRDLERRIRRALDIAFGDDAGARTIVYHGFYFYEPDQWAWFQLLREVPGLSQVFIVHDDGQSPTTETWRRFFTEDLDMPSFAPSAQISGSVAGNAVRTSVSGGIIDADMIGSAVRIVRCDNVPQFVRLWSQTRAGDLEEDRNRRTYAPAASDVRRTIERLVPHKGTVRSELRDIPAGRFLLAAHRCLIPETPGSYRIEPQSLVEMVDSQFLGAATPAEVSVFRRVLPYFDRCTTDDEWLARAAMLRDAIHASRVLEPAPGDGDGDLTRIAKAAASAVRLLPWADLTDTQMNMVVQFIRRAVQVVREVGASHNIAVGQHFRTVWKYLEFGWRSLPDDHRAELLAKFKGFSAITDEPLALEGMLDMVSMLLGAAVGEPPSELVEDDRVEIRDIRGLDALGYRPAAQSIHLANMSGQLFPARTSLELWPFTEQGLASSFVQPDAAAVLRLRGDTAGLSDLYLLWLALNDGTEPGGQITISWIAEQAGKPHVLSPLVSVMSQISDLPSELITAVGGIPISMVPSAAELPAVLERPEPAVDDVDPRVITLMSRRVPVVALASADACPRRFALQWVIGSSPAFQMRHHQSLLYGNTVGRLAQAGLPVAQVRRLADALWAYLTPGERASSLDKSRVHTRGRRTAHPLWTLTLGGSKDAGDPLSRAYQTAISGRPPTPRVLGVDSWGILPDGTTRADVCDRCPVRPSCSVWADSTD